jgi:hypothetical protein
MIVSHFSQLFAQSWRTDHKPQIPTSIANAFNSIKVASGFDSPASVTSKHSSTLPRPEGIIRARSLSVYLWQLIIWSMWHNDVEVRERQACGV